MKQNIRKAETSKLKAEARIEYLRNGGVNVDEWLQEAETLNVQDIQRSTSSLSMRTDASGAGACFFNFFFGAEISFDFLRIIPVRIRSMTATTRMENLRLFLRKKWRKKKILIQSSMKLPRSTVSGVGDGFILALGVWHDDRCTFV